MTRAATLEEPGAADVPFAGLVPVLCGDTAADSSTSVKGAPGVGPSDTVGEAVASEVSAGIESADAGEPDAGEDDSEGEGEGEEPVGGVGEPEVCGFEDWEFDD